MADHGDLKLRLARTLKWNALDKILSQGLYFVTGVILANILTQADYGLVGAVMVFQAFAALFIDSGFGYALIQRKDPTQTDYSTVLWFNLGMALTLYILLWFCAPLIADVYRHDERLIPLSRVMFLTFILNALSTVQINRLIKRMEMRMVTVANNAGLLAGAVTGITMALYGFGVGALVAQYLVQASVKALIMWTGTGWRPSFVFSFKALRGFMNVGLGVMGSSFLNILFQNIYSFFIGHKKGLVSLGYYSKADDWSKMGIASLSAILNQAFLPVLSQFKDDPAEYANATSRMNKMSGYLLFPFTVLAVTAAPALFHSLFGTKWDASIILFRLLMIRGIFTVLNSLYHQYMIGRAKSKLMFGCELFRDIVALAALLLTLPYLDWSTPERFTLGVEILLWGQLAASGLCWVVTMFFAARVAGRNPLGFVTDLLPYVGEAMLIGASVWWLPAVISNPWLLLAAQTVPAVLLYVGLNALLRSHIQTEVLRYIWRR